MCLGLKSRIVVAIIATIGLFPGQEVFAGSDHGVRILRLIKPAAESKSRVATSKTTKTTDVKSQARSIQEPVVVIPDEGPYRRRYTPDHRPWGERRSAFVYDNQREFQNPTGLYSSQIGRAFD